MRFATRSILVFLLTSSMGFASSMAHAQAVDSQRAAAAQALYDAAGDLMDAAKYADACPKLEEAVRLEPSAVGAKLRLAQCYEGQKRYASAWTMYLAAEGAAHAANQHEREQRAHDGAAALEGRASRLTIHVAPEVRALPGLTIDRDGSTIGDGQLDVPIPLDGGVHAVHAIAQGKKAFSTSITLDDEGTTARVEIARLEDVTERAVPLPVSSSSAVARPVAPPTASPVGDRAPAGTTIPTWTWVVGGAAISFGAASTVFGADLLSVTSRQRALCGDGLDACEQSPDYDPAEDNARKHRDYGFFVAFGAAGVVAGAAAVLGVVTAKRAPETKPSSAIITHLTPWIGPTSLGFAGRF